MAGTLLSDARLDRSFAAVVVDARGTVDPGAPLSPLILTGALDLARAGGVVAIVVDDAADGALGIPPDLADPAPGLLLVAGPLGVLRVRAHGAVEAASDNAPGLGSPAPGSDGADRAAERLADHLWRHGVAPAGVLGVTLDGAAGGRAELVGSPPDAGRDGTVPTVVADSADAVRALLDDQRRRRRDGRVPAVAATPGWIVEVEGERASDRVTETLFTLGDGWFGTRGAIEEGGDRATPLVLATGVYDESHRPELLHGPTWTGLDVDRERLGPIVRHRRVLDLRTGLAWREVTAEGGVLRTLRFASPVRPGTVGLRAEATEGVLRPTPCLAEPTPEVATVVEGGERPGGREWLSVRVPSGGGMVAVARSRAGSVPADPTDPAEPGSGAGTLDVVERLAAYAADPVGAPDPAEPDADLDVAESLGFDALLVEHRAGWARRWADAEVSIDGDPDVELGLRFALFHLLGSAPDEGEAAVGARGLSGRAYAGHVFWDSDVFVLPTLAAVNPAAARAMLDYRVNRLPVARDIAARHGREGARFPWESARTGVDVTPASYRDHTGEVVPILTGDLEEHIHADIAWAAWHYARWTGDTAYLHGPGRGLVVETARYWASRVRLGEDGRGHIEDVIGPDEYHEHVDDNAYTNVMARWNLNLGADLIEDGDPGTAARWRALGTALVNGYDPATGIYEQFRGFHELEPLIITELADPPIAADVLLGHERLHGSQVVKQADVLMLHHLVPDETEPGSLAPNLDHYHRRTAHGSSLSPAIHASLLARAGREEEARDFLALSCRLDLDDLTRSSAEGLHVATMGGVWQALIFGFLGVRAREHGVQIDPRLPERWRHVDVRFVLQGRRVRLGVAHDELEVDVDGPLPVHLPGLAPVTVTPPGARFTRGGDTWSPA